MKTLSGAIMKYAEGLPEAGIIRAKDLLHLGSRTAVDQALSRLTKRRHLLRVSQGFYIRILENSFGKYTPPVPQVIENIANITGESVTPHPAATANRLRLNDTGSDTYRLYYFRTKSTVEIWSFSIRRTASCAPLAVQRRQRNVRKSA